jgi:transcription initiation factor TFIIIB Brf1 subunit/transcription initiation factor TFIIB
MTSCPECGSSDVEGDYDYRYSDVWQQIIHYICNDCGCEFDEKISLTIEKHGSRFVNDES